MLEFDRLKEIVASAEDDVAKVDRGNKAAGTRVRKTMQEIKGAAQEVRIKCLELKTGPAAPAPPAEPPAAPPVEPPAE